ncbi:MAG: 2TM domain-containing protein [Polaribacter sp.]|jgi:hypothetical protein|nr:2TM domain-containing protein [Polaribacter sp.]MDG2074038.1 2TM domain-containing protein [Polaribacter sp.]
MRNEENFEGIKYLKAKKRVEKIKGFYIHLIVYIVVNLFLSGIIIYGLMSDEGDSFEDVINNFGIYSTWVFWGIGVFFHWLGVFGFNALGKNWEEKKLKQIMEEEERKYKF